jgi:hypothetical protein
VLVVSGARVAQAVPHPWRSQCELAIAIARRQRQSLGRGHRQPIPRRAQSVTRGVCLSFSIAGAQRQHHRRHTTG